MTGGELFEIGALYPAHPTEDCQLVEIVADRFLLTEYIIEAIDYSDRLVQSRHCHKLGEVLICSVCFSFDRVVVRFCEPHRNQFGFLLGFSFASLSAVTR